MHLPEITKGYDRALRRQGAIFLDDKVHHQRADIFKDADNDTYRAKSTIDLTKDYLKLEREKRLKRARTTQDDTGALGTKRPKIA